MQSDTNQVPGIKMQAPLVEVLMVTYNGARLLPAQIESLLAQSHGNWRLLLHDDGSQDATAQLVADYALRYPEQIIVLRDGVACGGAKYNFAHLMAHASADYIMFADQDDIWLPDKMKDSLQRFPFVCPCCRLR